jgi:PIN domain nuclease of toxin-antitoxin system
MIIVLDSNATIWLSIEPTKLTKKAAKAIETANYEGKILLSPVTLWEIAWLQRRDRIGIKAPFQVFVKELLQSYTIEICPITVDIALETAMLPMDVSRDPADRLISATSIVNHAPLVTSDSNLRKSKHIDTIW